MAVSEDVNNSAHKNTKCNRQARPERSQWDTLMTTLWVSRLLGVAPIYFVKDRPGCPATTSKPLFIYGRVLLIILHVSIILGTVQDSHDASYGIRMRTFWTSFAWFSELFLLMITTTVGVFGAFDRLQTTILQLDAVAMMKSEIKCTLRSKKKKSYIILYILLQIILLSVDFLTFFFDSFKEGKDYNVMFFYTSFYLEQFVLFLLELEFTCVAIFILSGLKSINKAFEDLIYIIDLQRTASPVSLEEFDVDKIFIPLLVEPVNTLVDRMTSLNQITTVLRPSPTTRNTSKNIRKLTLAYGTICDVIARINDKYGLLLLLFIASYILHFIVTPLYFLTFWHSSKPRTINLTVQIFFVIFHFSYMLLVVEPGYMTEHENERTQVLARQLMQRVMSPKDPMFGELDILLKQIELNKVYYSPLSFCKLTRSLITAILGGATSYVVIILQFQRMNEDDV